jgi:hypothetical protein
LGRQSTFLDGRDPHNLLTMLWTWQNGNVGRRPAAGSTATRSRR